MKKKTKRVIWISIVVVIVLLITAAVVWGSRGKKQNGPKTVKVERKNIVDKALAVGNIEPRTEIAVKSKISGVVRELFVEVGDFVNQGDLLVEIKPDPTPLELAEAKRNVELAEIELHNLSRERERQRQLIDKGLISEQEFDNLSSQYDEASLRHQMTKDKLELIEKGKVQIAETSIETVIKAPITGFILEKLVNVGDPVVPLTSYQPGTGLFKIANMEKLLFKGTIDEIDVGKISEGMKADLQVGALPGKSVQGHISLISLKAKKEENTTVFPIEIVIDDTDGAVLRAGFSANAHIIIAKKDSVLAIPERVITFRNDSAFVKLPVGEKESKEQYIETGLSDAIHIEVVSGLEEGQEVLEKEVKEIT